MLLYTLAPPSGQTKKHRRVLKGSGDRECCQEQYLFWLLVSKMALGCHRQECPYLATVNPLRNWQTVNPSRVKHMVFHFWCIVPKKPCIDEERAFNGYLGANYYSVKSIESYDSIVNIYFV